MEKEKNIIYLNAIIKNYGIRVSERYSKSMEIWLELELQGGGCCIFTAWGPYTEDFPHNAFGYSLKRVLDICGVNDVKDIKGKTIRTRFDHGGYLGDVIKGIGHIINDDWFVPSEEKIYQNY